MPTDSQRFHALTSYFISCYRESYKRDPVVNRNTAKWGWQSILMDMTDVEAKTLVDYYFTTRNTQGHNLEYFFKNYHVYLEAMEQTKIDAEHRAKLRRESEKRAQEWRDRIANNRTTGS